MESYRKEELRKGLFSSPTTLQFRAGLIVDDYGLKEWITERHQASAE